MQSIIMEDEHCHQIPSHIILFHILPRLPINSLHRCKSVCTQWRSFLKTRIFANLHTRHLTNGSTGRLGSKLLLILPHKSHLQSGFRIMDCEALDDGLIDQRHPFPFETNLCTTSIQTSLHGLVCVCGAFKRGIKKSELVLWNPLTREYRMLINPYYSEVKALGLYYSGKSNKEYKLLTVLSDLSVHIYSLKSDSWRQVDSIENYQTLIDIGFGWEVISSTWLNRNLYFLEGSSVLKFNTKTEKFTIIPTHPSLKDLHIKSSVMNVQKGVLHLGVNYEIDGHQNSKTARIQLWRMIADESWEKVGAPYKVDIHMRPFHWLGNKTWLMIELPYKDLYKVDYSKNYTKGKNYITRGKSAQPIINMYAAGNAKVNYIESFMSIDGSI